MDLQLKDKLVLVTGSTAGIGKATAEAFLAEGAEASLQPPISDRFFQKRR